MAAAMLSVSESIQASIIIHQQLQQQTRHLSPTQQQQPQLQSRGIGFCTQVLLVSALFGIEMVSSFEQIYQILILQYLGVPVSMVSINGIVCGGISMFLLPILGYISDRGSNPKLRKMLSLYMAMGMFICGLGLLMSCGFIKLSSQNVIPVNNITNITNMATLTLGVESDNDLLVNMSSSTLISSPIVYTTAATRADTGASSGIPATAFMSIIGFAMMDIGFDMSVALIRAFILENTPTFQHTRLLVMATVVASTAGTTFSIIGCFDFPHVLGRLFQVEGVAASLIFFCSLLVVILCLGYICTTVTGFVISKQVQTLERTKDVQKLQANVAERLKDSGTPRLSKRRFLTGRSQSQLEKLREDRPYVPDILHTEEGDASTRPLLLEDSMKAYNYSAISASSTFLSASKDVADPDLPPRDIGTRNISRASSIDSTSKMDDNGAVENEDNNTGDVAEREEGNPLMYEQQHAESGVSALMAAVRQSYSMSVSVMYSPLGEFHTKKLEQLQETTTKDPRVGTKTRLKTRLVILTVSSFFTVGSSLGFIIYTSNTLTIGIFHGDPTAPVGTPGYALYEKGLQTAAIGNLVLYSAYMVVSMNNTKIIDLIGEKVQFVVCHVLLMVSLLIVILLERVEAYFVFMVFCGAFRTCAFTLPYVLANKITQEEAPDESRGQPSKNLGKVMSLIGFLMPAHFILMSTFMGPLMDATGNVWVPLIYSFCTCALSVIIFSSLFFIKN